MSKNNVGALELRKEANERRGRLGVATALVVGFVVGAALVGATLNARAQNPMGSNGSNESVDLRGVFESNAAPRVTSSANGQTKFSRPLEVPPLYAFDSPLDATGRQIILVDAETKRICVYWIRQRGANSTIELVATRAYELDLTLENFNGEGLTPSQIREQLNGI
jgi:hypothetical protein